MKKKHVIFLVSIAIVSIVSIGMSQNNTSKNSAKYVIHTADSRGILDYGWLKAQYSFSFGQYRNQERMNFGALRVLNNDIVAPGRGFNKHKHDNMEIITIPLSGALKHKDDLGNSSIIPTGEIQVMSAGTGIYHSEFNASEEDEIELFQIWIFPHTQNVEPRYQQKSIIQKDKKNTLYQILSPQDNDGTAWIHQQAWMYMGDFDTETNSTYTLKSSNNGVYIMNIQGSFEIDNKTLSKRDAIGIWNTNSVSITAAPDSRILIIEVPM